MASNGRLPASQLASISGSGPYGSPKLRTDAASAYNALHSTATRRYGVSMALNEGRVGRAYRSYARQVEAKRTYGRNAATPGYSNHGWGIAVDLMNRRQRYVIDVTGASYGWSKKWSDASWEWWHIRYKSGVYRGRPPAPRPKPIAFTKHERRIIYLIRTVRKRPSTPERRRAIRGYKQEIIKLRQEIRDAARRDGWNKNDRKRRYKGLGKVYNGG
jgi:hypothetical protein